MLVNLEIGINYSDVYRNEALCQILNSLECLEKLSDEVFDRINRKVK